MYNQFSTQNRCEVHLGIGLAAKLNKKKLQECVRFVGKWSASVRSHVKLLSAYLTNT